VYWLDTVFKLILDQYTVNKINNMSYLDTKNIIFALFTLLLLTFSSFTQWIKISEIPGNDQTLATTCDAVGNIYMAGYRTLPNGNEDMLVIKYNSEGGLEWIRFYGGPGGGNDRAWGIVVDTDRNVIITGYSVGVGSGTDFTTVKFSPNGVQQWVSRYNEPGNGDDKAWGIVVDRIGNIYVTGYIARVGTDMYTIKYNSSGEYIWGQLINGTASNSDDKAWGIVVDSIGNNIYICGQTENTTTGYDFTVACYDSSGVREWLNIYDGTTSVDKAWGIVVDTDNLIYVTGESSSANGRQDCMTIKYNSGGDTLWTARYNGPALHNDKSFGIVVDTDGNPYITGYETASDTLTTNYLFVKYSFEGEQLWANTYNGPANWQDTAYSICLSKSQEFVYVTGGSSSDTVAGKLDVLTLRIPADSGNTDQSARYPGNDNMNDAGTGVVADTLGNIYVAGYIQTVQNGYDMIAMKYQAGGLIAVNVISTQVPKGFSLYQNYPNPFNPVTTIKFDVQKQAFVKLRIYDILGREVALLVNENLRIGSYEAIFSSAKLASGIYFYEMTAGDYRDTKKMVLVK
jgi:uncharacterized delta-60 repeat protein